VSDCTPLVPIRLSYVAESFNHSIPQSTLRSIVPFVVPLVLPFPPFLGFFFFPPLSPPQPLGKLLSFRMPSTDSTSEDVHPIPPPPTSFVGSIVVKSHSESCSAVHLNTLTRDIKFYHSISPLPHRHPPSSGRARDSSHPLS